MIIIPVDIMRMFRSRFILPYSLPLPVGSSRRSEHGTASGPNVPRQPPAIKRQRSRRTQ
jgi:hypothetical protein